MSELPAFGRPRLHLRRAASTSDRARELAQAGAPEGTVVTATEQASGRGRQGRTWLAPPGRALALSAIVRPLDERVTLLPLAAGLAVSEACERLAPGAECRIKWPNDVWIEERKVAGILLEGRPAEGWAVAGIGLNVDVTAEDLPAELRATATSLLLATGAPVGLEPSLRVVLERLGAELGALRAEGAAQLLERYRERDALRDREIAWREGAAERRGRAVGIDQSGSLVVEVSGGGLVALDAGEVHLLRA